MKMKEHEVLYAKAKTANDFNTIAIDLSLNEIEKHDDVESNTKNVENIRKGLDTREKFHEIECDYVRRKAWRKGYITALAGAVGGILFDTFVTPKIVSKFKKN